MTVKNHLSKIGLLIGLGLIGMGAAQANLRTAVQKFATEVAG